MNSSLSNPIRNIEPWFFAACLLGGACSTSGSRPDRGVAPSSAATPPGDRVETPAATPLGTPSMTDASPTDGSEMTPVVEAGGPPADDADAAISVVLPVSDGGEKSLDAAAHDGEVAVVVGNGLIVHEWGTYTSMQASDGHCLGGVHHEDEALPSWVHRRNFNDPQNYYFERLPEEPRQQLETPVLYFYSNTARDVQVSVAFPLGVVGEWYPETASFVPAIGAMTAIAQGSAVWNLGVDPGIVPASFKPVLPGEIWAPARHVASTPVHVKPPVASSGDEFEQFLFYRGLGTFVAPVTISSNDDQTLHVRNDSTDGVGSAFLLLSTPAGSAFVSLGALAPRSETVVSVPAPDLSVEAYVLAAQIGLQDALVRSGLYSEEARAMVDTWTRSWFRTAGLRILYVAPQAWTEGWLPTKVTPEPSAMIRTLVGRIEVLRPSDEANVLKIIQAASQARTSVDVAPLGRFAESRLERAVEQLTEPQAKTLADDTRKLVHALP